MYIVTWQYFTSGMQQMGGGESSNDCFVAYHLRMIVNENQSVQFRCIILV